MKKAALSRGNSLKDFDELSFNKETDLENVADVDREFEELLTDVKRQAGEEDDAALGEEKLKQETSTDANIVQYDELR